MDEYGRCWGACRARGPRCPDGPLLACRRPCRVSLHVAVRSQLGPQEVLTCYLYVHAIPRWEWLDIEPLKSPPPITPQGGSHSPRPAVSEHAVVVCRLFGNDLEHVPMLHDLAVAVESKNVDARIVVVARPVLVTVQDH